MKKYDAIVIGAGNGGLVAANVLALNKKRVLLLEKHRVSGGFATSFVRGRFEFEASLHEMCDYGSGNNYGNVRKLFKKIGIEGRLEMVDVPDAFRVIFDDEEINEDYTMPFGIDSFIEKMEDYVPGSKRAMTVFFDLAKEIKGAFSYFNDTKGHPDSKVLKNKFPNFMRVASYSVRDVFYAIEMPIKAQRILNTYWIYLGVPESKMSFVHYALMVLLYIDYKAQIPLLRSHDISLTLENRFLELGGEIKHGAKVVKIMADEGGVKGVCLENGEEYYSDYIISNVMADIVYGKLIDSNLVPLNCNQSVNFSKLGAQGLCIYLGLNKSKEELGLKDYTYFIYRSFDSDEEYEKMSKMDNDSMVVVCLNKAIPDCSPKGTTILYFTSLYFGNCFSKNVNLDNYYRLKDDLANKFIDRFESTTGIKIKDYIEEIEVATPLTYARYTDSPDGVIYGYSLEGNDVMLARLMDAGYRNSIKGLFFCGGASVRGSGYNSAYISGEMAALLALAEMKGGEFSESEG